VSFLLRVPDVFSNFSCCCFWFLLVPCSVPRLLYILYGDIGLIITSLLYSLYCSVIVRLGSAGAITGDPFSPNWNAKTYAKHLSRFNAPPVARRRSFHSCASYCVLVMISLTVSHSSPLFVMLLLSTNPSIPMMELYSFYGSSYLHPYPCLSCMPNNTNTILPRPCADAALPCLHPNTGDSVEWW
jgi:hypothetical protein